VIASLNSEKLTELVVGQQRTEHFVGLSLT
jgi:hypothetical protein